MSFGYSAGDAFLLVQLAYKTLQSTRRACGEHDDLTREVSSLHKALKRIKRELETPESLLNRPGDNRKQELREIGDGCLAILNVLISILEKYNALPDEKRSGRKLWQKIRFGNGEMQDLSEIRLKLSTHTSAILIMVNLCSLGSQGRVETQLNSVGGELEGIRGKVNWIAANMTTRSAEGTMSVWTSYANDDKALWRELRSELNKEGYDRSVLRKHRRLIKRYVQELGNRGLFDQVEDESQAEENDLPEDDDPAEEDSSAKDRGQIQKQDSPAKGESERDDHEDGENQLKAYDQELLNSTKRTGVEFARKGWQPLNSSSLSQFIDDLTIEPSASSTPLEDQSPDIVPSKSGIGLSTKPKHPIYMYHQKPRAVQIEDVTDEHFVPRHPTVDAALDEDQHFYQVKTKFDHRPEAITPSLVLKEFLDKTSGEAPQAGDPNSHTVGTALPSTSDFKLPLVIAAHLASDIARSPGGYLEDDGNKNVEEKSTIPKLEQMPEDGKRPIKFRDAIGRKFPFPFKYVRSWQGMEECIRQVFLNVDKFGTHVNDGHYDLIGPHGEIILPQFWEDLVQPDWPITMQMWPIPKPPPEPLFKSPGTSSRLFSGSEPPSKTFSQSPGTSIHSSLFGPELPSKPFSQSPGTSTRPFFGVPPLPPPPLPGRSLAPSEPPPLPPGMFRKDNSPGLKALHMPSVGKQRHAPETDAFKWMAGTSKKKKEKGVLDWLPRAESKKNRR